MKVDSSTGDDGTITVDRSTLDSENNVDIQTVDSVSTSDFNDASVVNNENFGDGEGTTSADEAQINIDNGNGQEGDTGDLVLTVSHSTTQDTTAQTVADGYTVTDQGSTTVNIDVQVGATEATVAFSADTQDVSNDEVEIDLSDFQNVEGDNVEVLILDEDDPATEFGTDRLGDGEGQAIDVSGGEEPADGDNLLVEIYDEDTEAGELLDSDTADAEIPTEATVAFSDDPQDVSNDEVEIDLSDFQNVAGDEVEVLILDEDDPTTEFGTDTLGDGDTQPVDVTGVEDGDNLLVEIYDEDTEEGDLLDSDTADAEIPTEATVEFTEDTQDVSDDEVEIDLSDFQNVDSDTVEVVVEDNGDGTEFGTDTLGEGAGQAVTLDSNLDQLNDQDTLLVEIYESDPASEEALDSDTATASQTQSVSGTVFEADGETEVSDGTIEIYEGQGDDTGESDATVQLGGDAGSADGSYSFSDLPTGDSHLVVSGVTGFENDSRTINLDTGQDLTQEDFTLTEITTGSFSGTVTDDGEPVTEEVTFEDSQGEVLGTATPDGTDGSYTVEDVEEGEYTITASADGFEADTTAEPVTITATQDTANTDFTLTAITTGSFSGTITDASAESTEIADTQVTFTDSEGNQLGQTTTGDSGQYTVENVEAGDYTITASADGFKPRTTESAVTITATEETETTDFSLEEAGEVQTVEELQINADFIGIVADDNNSVSLTASGFKDEDGATIVDDNVDVNIGGNDYTVSIDENGEVDAEIDPEEISAAEETGQTEVSVVGADAEDAATDSVTLVHEAHNLNEGFNLKSIPQPAELYEENVSAVNQWNTGDETYDAGIPDGTISSAGDLHRGLYVDANADARLGYEFETDTVPSPGDVQLENGWHLASSNFAIDTESGTRTLNDDLVNLPDADQPGITVYADDQRTTFAGSSDVNAYDTYWVFIDDPERTDRGVVAPNYNATDRGDILQP